jgi:chromosomal replication initiation ATPase DnaA
LRLCGKCGKPIARTNLTNPPRHNYTCNDMTQPLAVPSVVELLYPPTLASKPEDLIKIIAEQGSVTVAELCGPSKEHKYSHARFLAYYLLVLDAKLRYEDIGPLFGNRSKTTIFAGYQSAQANLAHYRHDIAVVRAKYNLKAAE